MFTKNYSNGLLEGLKCLNCEEFKQKQINCLEIGCFEGRGTLIILEQLAVHKNSKIYCVDPFEDCYVKDSKDFTVYDPQFVGQYERFTNNTKHSNKLITLRGYSNDMIPTITDQIDFCFIDGDHSANQVYLDAVNTFKILKVNGIIVFDDYLWKCGKEITKNGIDQFLNEFKDQIKVLHIGYSVTLQKLK